MLISIWSWIFLLVHAAAAKRIAHDKRTNVLFIIFDDLRPLMNAYGEKHMITPNFDRLAAKSVIFDNAHCQVAVCNPSRNSLVTGLRPDSIRSYAFERSHHPFMSFPVYFEKMEYNMAGYGKVYHWDDFSNKLGVGFGIGESRWYEYQNEEWGWVNSSVNPDRHKPESEFQDYKVASKAINGIKVLSEMDDYFFVGIGFKLPHLLVHFPHKYFDMYRSRKNVWERTNSSALAFPSTAHSISYRCCAGQTYQYLNKEGDAKFIRETEYLHDIKRPIPLDMHVELMWAYSAAITYLDTQLGRVLDTIDELDLWHNLTVILTADHGMHNGEKGIWEKWTLFEEATRVPLMIHHPDSPYKGTHYSLPVESVDIYPTMLDLFGLRQPNRTVCSRQYGLVCRPLQGQSLAPAIIGSTVDIKDNRNKAHKHKNDKDSVRPLAKNYAITQVYRCADRQILLHLHNESLSHENRAALEEDVWDACAVEVKSATEVALMGYSLRTRGYRYTCYVHFAKKVKGSRGAPRMIMDELYDHTNDEITPSAERETVNVADLPKYKSVREKLQTMLFDILTSNFNAAKSYPIV